MFVGCVTYRYNSSDSPHSTRFGFRVSLANADGSIDDPYTATAFTLETITDVPVDRIVLLPFFNLFNAD
jgi:hypothetical protein